MVATFWVFLSLVVPMWREPLLMELARFSCPILMISFALNFGVKWYWVMVTNALFYAAIGLLIEEIRRWFAFIHDDPKIRQTS
jgi:hypothetical protein